MDFGLQETVPLVTEVSSGIGRAIALGLAAEGARLVATDVHMESVAETATAAQALGCEALALPAGASHITGQTLSVSGGYTMV